MPTSLPIRFSLWLLTGLFAIAPLQASDLNRSPVDLAMTKNGRWLITANQTSNSVTLIDRLTRKVVHELSIGQFPVATIAGGGESEVWVSCRDSGDLHLVGVQSERLVTLRRIFVGYHPAGMAYSKVTDSLWVAKRAAGTIVEIGAQTGELLREVTVGNWPERLLLDAPNDRLIVTVPGRKGLAFVNTKDSKVVHRSFRALNIAQPVMAPGGDAVLVPWMVYRTLPINESNIRRGWVWGSRLGRIAYDDSQPRKLTTLDSLGRAVADVCGTALLPKENQLVVTASGTHELLWFQLGRLPWRDYAATDHMDARLREDRSRFRRIDLGGRPMGIIADGDTPTVYVANYLKNAIQVVNLESFQVEQEIALGGPESSSLARQGAAVFYDARNSLDQWYSCHTCHLDGGTNVISTDTLNDGSIRTFKTILPLYHLDQTGPWTWHGWQEDLHAAMHKSVTSTMLGKPPTDEKIRALVAFLSELKMPVNPYATDPKRDNEAIGRGRELFHSKRFGCTNCHQGKYLTDGRVHDVGTGADSDKYDGFNTPSLLGLVHRLQYLHDGRAVSLESLLREAHNPADVSGSSELSDNELRELVAYLRSL